MPYTLDKNTLRIFYKQKLESFSKTKASKDYCIFKHCFSLVKKFKAKNILLFIPLKHEPNLLKFRRLFSLRAKIFVPFMQDKSLKIVKLRLPFTKKKYGVREPNISFLNCKLDLAIIPVIAVDKNLRRIGHGKGFYDRFFASFDVKPRVVFVENIFAFCDKNLTQKHDVKAKYYISPYKKIYKRDKNDRITNSNNCRYHRRSNRIFSY